MMINLLSIRCSLAFAPYLRESLTEFIDNGSITSRVVRQGGKGLIIRSDGDLVLRHEQRQAALGRDEARHYSAAIKVRSEFYEVLRTSDEVVLANAGGDLLLSHPQSEIWLNCEAVAALLDAFSSRARGASDDRPNRLPEWLNVSTGDGRILLSDQRTGRWLLLGADHLCEFENRLRFLRLAGAGDQSPAPPNIQLRGLTVHLQSAFKLFATLTDFALNENVTPFEEVTPAYSLKASGSTEGLELSDSNNRITLTTREARKWADLIRTELERLNAKQIERGGIRTVFASNEKGWWILQWGDEVFLSKRATPRLFTSAMATNVGMSGPFAKRCDEFLVLLSPATGACVALTDSESAALEDATWNSRV